MKYFIGFNLLFILLACENKIHTYNERSIPEPDIDIRLAYEVNKTINVLANEIKNSTQIETSSSGQKLINSGVEILPYLSNLFLDSTELQVFSTHNSRHLTKGELAIIVASKIKRIPIAQVVGIQQCTPPFDHEIEHFLWKIKDNPSVFIEKYKDWLKTEI